MAVAITRRDLSAGDLRREAARTRDAKAARRMLAIALVLEGRSREDAAASCGMDRQTLRDWAHRYNAEGLAGWPTCPGATARGRACRPGRKRWWPSGPSRGRTWRATASCAGAARTCGTGSGARSGSACTTHGGQAAGQARLPAPVGASAASPERPRGAGGFQSGFAGLVTASLPAAAAGKPVEIWFMDGRKHCFQPCRPAGHADPRWAKRGTLTRALRDRRYAWAWLFGAVCPERGVGAAVVLPTSTSRP